MSLEIRRKERSTSRDSIWRTYSQEEQTWATSDLPLEESIPMIYLQPLWDPAWAEDREDRHGEQEEGFMAFQVDSRWEEAVANSKGLHLDSVDL